MVHTNHLYLMVTGFAGSRSGSREAAASLDRLIRMVFTRWGRKALILVVSLAVPVPADLVLPRNTQVPKLPASPSKESP